MPNICQNEACRISFRSPDARRVAELVHLIRDRLDRGQPVDELAAHVRLRLAVFQANNMCRECGAPLLRLTQPTVGLDGEDLARTVEKNTLLIAGYELQALGILPF